MKITESFHILTAPATLPLLSICCIRLVHLLQLLSQLLLLLLSLLTKCIYYILLLTGLWFAFEFTLCAAPSMVNSDLLPIGL